jgi:hypothetical protein
MQEKFMLRSLFTAIAFTLPMIVFAGQGEAQKARFEPWLKTIETSLKSSNKADKVAEALLKGENRIAAFNLQALGKLYTQQDADFSTKIRSPFKKLEDGIGEFDKWQKIAEKSGKTKDKQRAEKAKKEFAEMLISEKWVGASAQKDRMNGIKKFLKDQDWQSYSHDKSLILQQLQQQVQNIAETQYDLGRLEKRNEGEDGKGLHELRREIRWFMIEARVLNGMLIFREDPKDCHVEAYKELYTTSLATSKYSTLPATALETDPCKIQQCLFLGLSQAVNVLGELKDAAEQDQEARETDTVPAALHSQAENLWQELQETQVFSMLGQNLRQCQ